MCKHKLWLFSGSDPISIAVAKDVVKKGQTAALPYTSETCNLSKEYPEKVLLLQRDFDPRYKSRCLTAVALATSGPNKTIDVFVSSFFPYMDVEMGSLTHAKNTSTLLRRQLNDIAGTSINMIEAVLPSLTRYNISSRPGGKIIQLTDINGSLPMPALGVPFIALKALEGYCESIAMSLAEGGIQLTLIEAPMELSLSILKKNRPYDETVVPEPSKITDNFAVSESSTAVNMILNSKNDNLFEEKLNEVVRAISYISVVRDPPLKLISGSEYMEQVKNKLAILSDLVDWQ